MTFLIAPAEAIGALQQQLDLQSSHAYADSDVWLALEAIRAAPPATVAIERNFAQTDTGQAFLQRIKGDPAFAGCAIHWIQMRRTPRWKVHRRVLLDGVPALLVDISSAGASVVGPIRLKPRQRVRLWLRDDLPPAIGVVVWVHFELPQDGPRYRAGVEFVAAAAGAVASYVSELVA